MALMPNSISFYNQEKMKPYSLKLLVEYFFNGVNYSIQILTK